MIIGIDGTPLTIPFPCGSKTYGEELLKALAKIDSQNKYYVFSSNKVKIPTNKNFKLINIPKQIPFAKRQLILPLQLKRYKIDLFHYLEPSGSMFLRSIPIVTTVFDFDLDQILPNSRHFNSIIKKFYINTARKIVFKNTDHIIAISNYTKDQLKSYTLTSNIKTTTIHLAPKKFFFSNMKKKKNGYVLALADFSPRKNVTRVINAYNLLPERLKKIHTLCLVISTKKVSENIKSYLKDMNLGKYSKVIISPSDNILKRLYHEATVFVYPSLYEGFGLPILEAMSCGCPVITSDRGATKEIAHNAALLINPTSTLNINKSLQKVLTDKSLRSKLSKKGLKHSKKFSWEKTATKTIDIYSNLYRNYC